MLKRLYYKKNETFNYEFFTDFDCKIPFDFQDVKNIYIELKEGDISPLFFLYSQISKCNLYIPFLPNTNQNEVYCLLNMVLHCRGNTIYTLSNVGDVKNPIACVDNTMIFNIRPNFSKYIPEDNAVLFLSENEARKYHYKKTYIIANNGQICNLLNESGIIPSQNRSTILHHFRNISLIIPQLHAEDKSCPYHIENINKVCKELKEKCGVEKVNLFALHCFIDGLSLDKKLTLSYYFYGSYFSIAEIKSDKSFISKIITTNSTAILKPQNNDRLKVIDCYDIFNDYVKSL